MSSPADPVEFLADSRVRNRRAALAGDWRIEDGRLWIGAQEFTYNAFQRSLFSPLEDGGAVGWHIFLPVRDRF